MVSLAEITADWGIAGRGTAMGTWGTVAEAAPAATAGTTVAGESEPGGVVAVWFCVASGWLGATAGGACR